MHEVVHSPLEKFLQEYADITGGIWEEIEPQVYDLMLPGREPLDEPEVVRLAFDPEAIPEHPSSQLASFGTPLVDRLLSDALSRGRHLVLYMVGLNLAPQALDDNLRRAVKLPAELDLKLEQVRPLHFPQAVFWFEATYVSDQKEQDLLNVAIDLHQSRQVRHLEQLLDRSRLAEKPWLMLPEARHTGLATAYPIARDRVIRTLSALANANHRELSKRLSRQLERIGHYYSDLRAEVEEQARKARNRDEDSARFIARLEALTREEELRSSELRRKNQLKVHLRLLNLLVIQQPKLLLKAHVAKLGSIAATLEWVWDPLVESVEAADCPECRHPTFEFGITRQGRLTCPACTKAASAPNRAAKS